MCSSDLVWVYTLFPLYPSYRTLMIVYPVSWLACVILLWWLYVHQQRRLKAGAAAAA